MAIGTAMERIEVSLDGMRELHIGRHPSELIKELIQNAFDEDSANACSVKVEYAPGEGTLVVVRDDGDGFRNVKDVWTLLGANPKRRLVNKRGRFNSGDKEVLAVAIWAKVETVGFTITFPEAGGRETKRNRRKSGTVFTVMMPWDGAQAGDLVERLTLIRPAPNFAYKVNGQVIDHPAPITCRETTLETVLQDGPGEPLRKTRRKTYICVSRPASPSGEGWIYEMGIPIQPIEPPYDVDVMQKVPLPPNRDTVRESYLQDVYAEVLNAIHVDMEAEDFSETWVRTAAEDSRITEEAAKDTLRRRYGDKVVMWTPYTSANMDAIDHGYEVLHPRTMSHGERQQLREKGGLETSYALFGGDDVKPYTMVDIANDPIKKDFARWVGEIGATAGLNVSVAFINKPESRIEADCTANSENPTVRFNTAKLDDTFFSGRGVEQLSLVIHELGHATLNGKMEHGKQWGEGCSIVGAALAASMGNFAAGG